MPFMTYRKTVLGLCCVLSAARASASAWTESFAVCQREPDMARRVGCYDGVIVERADPAPYVNRGGLRIKQERLTEAVADFDKALKLDGRNREALHDRALSRKKLKDLKGALQDAERLVELYPGDPDSFTDRGNARYALKRWEEAVKDFGKALESKPKKR